MDKKQVIEILKNLVTLENEPIVNKLLKKIEALSEEELNSLIEKSNITEENIEEHLKKIIEKNLRAETPAEPFINVNEMFSYGRTGNTVHMHIIPKDLHNLKNELGDEAFYDFYKKQLEDFLSKLQTIFTVDPTIEKLFAVSPIFFNTNISFVHESLGFDKLTEIDLNNENDAMSKESKEHFMNMFNKDGVYRKKVYYTQMSREKLLGKEYSELSEEQSHIKF